MTTTTPTTIIESEKAGRFHIAVDGVIVYRYVIGRPAAETARALIARMIGAGFYATP